METTIRSMLTTLGAGSVLLSMCFSVYADDLPPQREPEFKPVDFDQIKRRRQVSNPLVEWTHFGPGLSGYLDQFWIHDTDPNAMFMNLDLGNTMGTWNRADSWKTVRDPDGTGSTLTAVTAVEFSHQDPDYGIALAKEGVYSSHDRGRSWQFLVDIDRRNSEKHSVLTVDPEDDNIWYIGAGQHWLIKHTHFNKDGLYYSSDKNHSEGFILKSVDRGRTWTKYTNGIPADADFSKIIIDPNNRDRIIASNQHGVYLSDNAGESWFRSPGTGLPHNQPRDMTSYYDAETGQFILFLLEVTHYTPNGSTISSTGGVYRSYDSGVTWENMTGNLAIDLNRVNSFVYRDKYWRAIANWLDISKTQAQENYPDLPTDTFSQFIRIGVDPYDPKHVYLLHNFKHDFSFPPGNIWKTEDGGDNWMAVAREGPYWANEVDRDYWVSRGNPLGSNVEFSHVALEHETRDNPQTGPRFLLVNSLGEVYTAFAQQLIRSTDKGQTWKQIDDFETSPGSGHWVGRGGSNLPGISLNVNTGRPGSYLFGSGEHGLWRNTDDGDLVAPGAIAIEQLTGQSKSRSSPLSISTIAVNPLDQNKLYTLQFRQTQRGALRYSDNNGRTWETISTPVTFPHHLDKIKQYSLLIHPQADRFMFFCVPRSERVVFTSTHWRRNGPTTFNEFGIYRSTDGGLTWSIDMVGIPPEKSIYGLAFDPNNPNTLYAASNQTHRRRPGGLYRSTDLGESWSEVDLPDGIASVNEVKVLPSGAIYIATGTYANDNSTGGAFVSRDQGVSWELIFDMPNINGVAPSPIDENVMVVNVGPASAIRNLNPGAYATADGGATWYKINGEHGEPDRISVLEADPHNLGVFYTAVFGTGFWKIDVGPLVLHAPGRIEAEYYSAANDSSPGNAGQVYRFGDVDVEKTRDVGGGYNVGWTNVGEWLEFDIYVKEDGNYSLAARYAAGEEGGRFSYMIDGSMRGGTVAVGTTGGWQTWETVSTDIGALSEGPHTLRIYAQSDGFNLNWVEFTRQ